MKPRNHLLQYAALWWQKHKLDEQIAKLRERQRALFNGRLGFSSSFGEDENRADLTLDIPLCEYLAKFPEAEKECTLRTYETDHQLTAGTEQVPCIASYMRWPAKYVGSIPAGKKPLHLWVQCYSQTTYAPKAAVAIEINPAAAVVPGETLAA
jgi:hypothetical protein